MIKQKVDYAKPKKEKYKEYIKHEVKVIDYIYLNYNWPLRSLIIPLKEDFESKNECVYSYANFRSRIFLGCQFEIEWTTINFRKK